jgi:lauroyl/myristoyl acyltransferase
MAIDLQRIADSRFGVGLASFIGRTIPPPIGYRVADLIAGWLVARRQSKLIRVIRTNQWVVHGAGPGREVLDRIVCDALKNTARSLYNLYHYLDHPAAIQELVDLNPVARGLVARPEFSDRGLVLVGLHLSNFDLVLQAMCAQGLKALVLTIPDPQGGRRVEYQRRKKTGVNLVPASMSALRQAVKYLEQGGVILTGADRPVANPKSRPRFFGLASSLPTHHIHLAMKAAVPVMIIAARTRADGRYYVTTSEPIEMESDSEHEKAVVWNAERVLEEAEKFILQAPEQWSMPLPVWPDLVDSIPI